MSFGVVRRALHLFVGCYLIEKGGEFFPGGFPSRGYVLARRVSW